MILVRRGVRPEAIGWRAADDPAGRWRQGTRMDAAQTELTVPAGDPAGKAEHAHEQPHEIGRAHV